MEKPYYVCVDVGGTAIKYALVDETGCFKEKNFMPTQAHIFGGKGIVDKIRGIVKSYKDKFLIKGIAVSTAGIVDSKNGVIVYAYPKVIPGYTGTKLKYILEEDFRIPCCVENDVNCAALGEMWLGAGKGKSSLFCMTVGTSIGGCGILDKKLIRGASNAAGEIANMRVTKGLLHEWASTTKLIQDVKEAKGIGENELDKLDGKQIFEWAKNGDDDAKSAIYNLVQNLADGITNVAAILNPEIFILGGGIMLQKDYLKPLIDDAMKKRLFVDVYNNTEIAFAKLGNDAGMLGALYNFLNYKT